MAFSVSKCLVSEPNKFHPINFAAKVKSGRAFNGTPSASGFNIEISPEYRWEKENYTIFE